MKKCMISLLLAAVTVLSLLMPAAALTADATAALEDIAARYSQNGVAGDSNAPWLAADLMALDPALLSEAQKQAVVDEAIAALDTSSAPSDLSKYILCLTAMGYDPRALTTAAGEPLDAVAKLEELAAEGGAEVSNVYTLPYVLLALRPFGADLSALVQAALDSAFTGGGWGYVSGGTEVADCDAISAMVLALASEQDERVQEAISSAMALLAEKQGESGAIDNWGDNAASTGLAMCAYAAWGVDPATVVNDAGRSLIDGLLSLYDADAAAFPPTSNSFSTEQGLRGLIAAANAGNGTFCIYAFSADDLLPVQATFDGVRFLVTPEDANVKVQAADGTVCTPTAPLCWTLADGSYTYEVSCSGYRSESGTFTVVAGAPQVISVTLSRTGSAGAGDTQEKPQEPDTPVFDDVPANAWYAADVIEAASRGLLLGIDTHTFAPDAQMTRAMAVTVLWRIAGSPAADAAGFADVAANAWYAQPVGWALAAGLTTGYSETEFDPDGTLTRQMLATLLWRQAGCPETTGSLDAFTDAADAASWAREALCWAVEEGLLRGNGMQLLPNAPTTRAEAATILVRFSET